MLDFGAVLSLAAARPLDNRVRIVAVIVTAVMLGVVLELVRRRRLIERYALLWMVVALVLLVLAIWNQLLAHVSTCDRHRGPGECAVHRGPRAWRSCCSSTSPSSRRRLSEETKILAQEVARLDAEARAAAPPRRTASNRRTAVA